MRMMMKNKPENRIIRTSVCRTEINSQNSKLRPASAILYLIHALNNGFCPFAFCDDRNAEPPFRTLQNQLLMSPSP